GHHAARLVEHDHDVRGHRLGGEGVAVAAADAADALVVGRAVEIFFAHVAGAGRLAVAGGGANCALAALAAQLAGERALADAVVRVADLPSWAVVSTLTTPRRRVVASATTGGASACRHQYQQ